MAANYTQLAEASGNRSGDVDCLEYEGTFLNWLRDFCRVVNCTNDLCHKGWLGYEGHCYYFSMAALPWERSRRNCLSQESELLIIHSAPEQEFAATHNLEKLYWIGIKEMPLESTWMWVDGTYVEDGLTFWGPGFPDSYFDYESEAFKNCVLMRNGAWANAVCAKNYPWICKRRSEKLPITL
eukprot:gi/632991178/ref/XP_007884509.1/ PREDICTED: C-type lectin domain family 10 member A-like [Callorhinchus milii]